MNISSKITPVILCGGNGSRLWPLSRESFPKQFVPLVDGKSLLELTIYRSLSFNSPLIVGSENHRFLIKDTIDKISSNNSFVLHEKSILLEPDLRNTAAAFLCSAFMPSIEPSDLLLLLPSDHYIPDSPVFISDIKAGVEAALDGNIVAFGIHANYPSSSFVYIKKGDLLSYNSMNDNSSVFNIDSFIEKPDYNLALKLISSGKFYWNSGIFLCKAETLINAYKLFATDIYNSISKSMSLVEYDNFFVRPDSNYFLSCRSVSFDYAIMEHYPNRVVVPFNGLWSDLGTWNSIASLTNPDSSGNRIIGEGKSFKSFNTYINAPHRPVISIGTSDLIVIDTNDAVLVSSINDVETIKDVVSILKEENITQAFSHQVVYRPWGWFNCIDRGDNFQVKRIFVKPGACLSLQLHNFRAEHWIVVKGTAKVTINEETFVLNENESTYIPVGAKHRLENSGNINLELIEVQSGSYLGEDDIVRFEDLYGRN